MRSTRCSWRGWTDGLPIIPPTLARVEAMCATTARAPSEVLGEVEPLRGEATVEKIAANAVMAGCRPDYFPVVLAAVEAVLDPAFNMRGVQTTDENVAPLLIVSGPLAARLGINAGFGALGLGLARQRCHRARGAPGHAEPRRRLARRRLACRARPAWALHACLAERRTARGRRCTWSSAIEPSRAR
mgnify:CR=1 FL=1